MAIGSKGMARVICAVCLGWPALAATSVTGAEGLTVTVDAAGGYSVYVPAVFWRFAGSLGVPVSNLMIGSGADNLGPYSEIGFDLQTDAPRHAAIRVYGNYQAVLFSQSNLAGSAPNSFSFPSFSQYPQNLSHVTFSGIFAPPTFTDFSNESPWIFFDASANTFILSPENRFMAANTAWGPNGELVSGISPQIATLPAGFQYGVLLAIGQGIKRTFDTWGQELTALHGKKRPANDADPSLNQVGYWTDNGATYYYHTENFLSYQQTLSAIKSDFDNAGIGLGYFQLDSWFYPKGPTAVWTDNGDGIYEYTAAMPLFPSGLSSFQQSVGVPLITHSRWIDPSSPYRKMYQMSGNVVLDPRYWSTVSNYLAMSGVSIYEQDWLDAKAQATFNLADPETFLDNMGAAMARQNIDIQYCMASPRHFLHSTNHSNITTIRASEDRFGRGQWNNFLYTSQLASALGLWPFTDNLISSETENLLLATLSAGPVGIGDQVGTLNASNLLQSVRRDGVIVKPDVPLTPVDSSYLKMAQAVDAPQIAAAYSDFATVRTYYAVAYAIGSNATVSFKPSEIGLDRPAYLYDYFGGKGQVVNASDTVNATITNQLVYWVAAPIGPSGMALVGDVGQFVTTGKKRIPWLVDNGAIHVTVAFAAGETSRTIMGYAPAEPAIHVSAGSASPLVYDAQAQQFRVSVKPGSDGTASLVIRRIGLHPQKTPIKSNPARQAAE